jgi:hypothetical protein
LFFYYTEEVSMGAIESVGISTQPPTTEITQKVDWELEEKPADCSWFVFNFGSEVCRIDGAAKAVERWVRLVAITARVRLDWHYCGGRAIILYVGGKTGRARAIQVMNNLENHLNGSILELEYPPANGLKNKRHTIQLLGFTIQL